MNDDDWDVESPSRDQRRYSFLETQFSVPVLDAGRTAVTATSGEFLQVGDTRYEVSNPIVFTPHQLRVLILIQSLGRGYLERKRCMKSHGTLSKSSSMISMVSSLLGERKRSVIKVTIVSQAPSRRGSGTVSPATRSPTSRSISPTNRFVAVGGRSPQQREWWTNSIPLDRRRKAVACISEFWVRLLIKKRAHESFEKHIMWLTTKGRLLLHDLHECPEVGMTRSVKASSPHDHNIATWHRDRAVNSWSCFSAECSPFLPITPLRRWLRTTQKERSKHARTMQMMLRALWAGKAAAHTRKTLASQRRNFLLQEAKVRKSIMIAELNRCSDLQNYNIRNVESITRATITEFQLNQHDLLECRLDLTKRERVERRLLLRPLWEEWAQSMLAAKALILQWRAMTFLGLFAVRSEMKLLALRKEQWLATSLEEAKDWFQTSCRAAIASFAGEMTLDTTDMIRFDVGYTVTGREVRRLRVQSDRLVACTSPEMLCSLVDVWYMRVRTEEDTLWTRLVESWSRRVLRERLERMPFEAALVDNARKQRAALVQHMLKAMNHKHSLETAASFLKASRPSSAPSIKVTTLAVTEEAQSRPPVATGRTFSFSGSRDGLSPALSNSGASNPSFLNTAVGSPSMTRSPLSPFIEQRTPLLPHLLAKQESKTSNRSAPRPPSAPHRVKLGKDGFRQGMSPALQRAIGGAAAKSPR